jgi:uncharacterized membrane protein YfcA
LITDPYIFWSLGIVAGVLVGFSKTAIPGLGVLVVPILVSIFPAKEAVAVMLVMLMCGDVFAVGWYRHHAEWSRIWHLFPGILVGLIVGAFTLSRLTDEQLQPFLGVLVLVLVGLQLANQCWKAEKIPRHRAFAVTMGLFAGFATTVGNVAGAIMSIYLLAIGFSKDKFIGTGAWYYLIVNWLKVPIYAALGIFYVENLKFNVVVVPAIIVGALLGRWALPHIPRNIFDRAVLVLSAAGAAWMILR